MIKTNGKEKDGTEIKQKYTVPSRGPLFSTRTLHGK